MHDGLIEATRYLRNPLDVLAQQIVAHLAVAPCSVDELTTLVRRCASFADLTDDLLVNVLDLLSGRYPSEEFGELRPRIVWDRVGGELRARDGSRRLAVTSGGTIPDRGLFGVFLPDGTRVGELDEEMVYESRPGETFLLGASTWRIEDISFERVVVTPAPGQPGKMPFWHGDRPGRPLELGRALGAFLREVRELPPAVAEEHLRDRYDLDAWAAANVVLYLTEQVEATGVVPDDRTVVVERFRDEIGDWRVCLLSPFGTPVHAPWAMAIERRLMERYDLPVETMWSDDGIVIRLPEAADDLPIEELLIDPEDIDELVVSTLPQTSLFSARFRECAARALLLPRRRPDTRTPLWQQRQRAADLLAVAAKYPSFPILLEASRECLQDVFDVPALREVLGQLRSRQVRLVSVDTAKASPFAQSLLFNWIAAYMYEGDAPLAERRAAALALDRDLLRELLGAEELRELLDPGVLADLELELQCLTEGRRARSADELHDVLRRLGDLSPAELDLRTEGTGEAAGWTAELLAERRAIVVRIGAEERVIAAEDAARYRGRARMRHPRRPAGRVHRSGRPPAGATRRPVRPHPRSVPGRRPGPPLRARPGAGGRRRGRAGGRGAPGAGRVPPGRVGARVVRRGGAAPAAPSFARRAAPRGRARRAGGAGPLPAGLARDPRPAARARCLGGDARPAPGRAARRLDPRARRAAGPGAGLPQRRPRRPVHERRHRVGGRRFPRSLRRPGPPVLPRPARRHDRGSRRNRGATEPERPDGLVHAAIREHLRAHGASFWNQLRGAAPAASDTELLAALWDLVWAGEVTNDSLAPLRAFLSGGRGGRAGRGSAQAAARSATRPRGRPRPGRLSAIGPPAGAGRWSLVAPLLEPRPTSTEAAHATALQLLERHGVLTREAVLAEGVPGGFTSVYGVLKVLEERGQVRRGYFVTGLGAAQFALPGAVDRLRSVREGPDGADGPAGLDGGAAEDGEPPLVLATTDPAQPYGAALAWPETAGRPARAAGSLLVLRAGRPLVWLDRRGHHLVLFPMATVDISWTDALASLVKDGRLRSLEVRTVDGQPIADSPDVASALRRVGFADGYRGLVLRGG